MLIPDILSDNKILSKFPGLTEQEAAERIKQNGYNELPSTKPRSIFAIALGVVKEPMFILLIICGGTYLTLGDVEEAVMLLGFVFIIMGITFYQERKTERALEALKGLSSPRALVIRAGANRRIPGREVALDDIIIVSEGDRVPADALLLDCNNLIVDESLLTGESAPVRKTAGTGSELLERAGGDGLPFIYSGTLAVKGHCIAKVVRTGMETEIGKIGKILQQIEPGETSLHKEISKLVRNFAAAGILLCLLVIVFYGLNNGRWLNGFLAGITLAMAMLPEEFPVVLTVFLAIGAWRMSKKQVLARHIPAIETLGSATVLCVDKTGTLTLNDMTLKRLYNDSGNFDAERCLGEPLPENYHELLEFSILASQNNPFEPMEKAIKYLGNKCLAKTEHIHGDWDLVREYPLSNELLAISHVWKSPNKKDFVIAAKGSPEAIADLCHFSEAQSAELAPKINELAREGLRVLGVAKAHFNIESLPEKQHDFKFQFLGLVGLANPVRPEVRGSLSECYAAGIRVVMITGDYPGTAENIARQIGLKSPEKHITGAQIYAMSARELSEKIKDVNIFARVVPEQKLAIVNALKANGEVVAMTGDGVNDAPALKAADIGIAMGGRGTDVARESADLVLTDDNFSSIVQAVKMGRRIFDNLKKAMAYIFAVHVPIAGISLIPVILKWPLVLLPVHIVFLELIIDPACSVVFEAEKEEPEIMNRPPKSLGVPLFGRRTVVISLLQGLSVLIVSVLFYAIALHRGLGELEARALTFTTLVISNIALILSNRSWRKTVFESIRVPNTALWWVVGGALLFLGLVLFTPGLRYVFRFGKLHADDLALCAAAGAFSIAWFEFLKMFYGRRKEKPLLA